MEIHVTKEITKKVLTQKRKKPPLSAKQPSKVEEVLKKLDLLHGSYENFTKQKSKLTTHLRKVFSLKQELRSDLDSLIKERAEQEFIQLIQESLEKLPSTVPRLVDDEDPAQGFNKIISMVHALTISEQEAGAIHGNILIYDSNPNTNEVLKKHLSKDGHKITLCESWSAFKAELEKHSTELFFDLIMVEKSKINLSDFIQKVNTYDQQFFIPVILMGNEQNNASLSLLFKSGITDYLVKPINSVLLKKRVQAALEKKYAFEVRQRRQQEFLNLKKKLKTTISQIQDAFVLFSVSHKLLIYNDQILKIYPHWKDCKNLVGLGLDDFLYTNTKNIDRITDTSKRYLLKIEDCIELCELGSAQWYEITKDNAVHRISSYKTEDGHLIFTARDIVETLVQEQELSFMAYHDSLTGLANKKAFCEILDKKLSDALKEEEQVAVFFIDLDGFKVINDTYGHEAGDWLLIQVGHRLKRCIRESDLVARLGGDEFGIIVTNFSSLEDLTILLDRLKKSIKQPYARSSVNYFVDSSIGIAIFPNDATDGASLVQAADQAMYDAKNTGKGDYVFFKEIKQT